jgi:integrase
LADKGRPREEMRHQPLPLTDPEAYYRTCHQSRIEEKTMPSVQRGTLTKRSDRWTARWRDEAGKPRRRSFGSGREGKAEAAAFLERTLREVEALRRGDPIATRRQDLPTFGELVDEYVRQHPGEANTIRTLKARLRYATEGPRLDGQGGWKDVRIDRLTVAAIGAWRRKLPERSAWAVTKTLRQVLAYAVRAKLLDESPAAVVPNPEPKRREVPAFASLDELEAVGAELSPQFRPLPVFVALTGLRPEEWLALERGDIDKPNGVVHVRRVYVDGGIRLYGKQTRSLRAVPLPLRAAQALDELPPRLDSRLLFPGVRGGHLNLNDWRADEWNPGVVAAGFTRTDAKGKLRSARSPYALRHTFATFAIAAGVSLYELARFMGTSVEQIDRTYGHLLPDSIERARQALDAFIGERASDEASL